MKLHELFETKLLLESITLPEVMTLGDLKDPKTGKYFTGVVNVTGAVDLRNNQLTELPVKFGTVGGYFACNSNQLTSLQGAPSSVGGYFDCGSNKLTSLQGAPSPVGSGFYCNTNQLTSLQGAPSSVSGGFYCQSNQLTSLQGIHKLIKKIDGAIWLLNSPIHSGGIGLLLIDGLMKIYAEQPAFDIIERYLGQGKKGLLLCQDELIDAGYEEFAKL